MAQLSNVSVLVRRDTQIRCTGHRPTGQIEAGTSMACGPSLTEGPRRSTALKVAPGCLCEGCCRVWSGRPS